MFFYMNGSNSTKYVEDVLLPHLFGMNVDKLIKFTPL